MSEMPIARNQLPKRAEIPIKMSGGSNQFFRIFHFSQLSQPILISQSNLAQIYLVLLLRAWITSGI
jgi:hypothetical protein